MDRKTTAQAAPALTSDGVTRANDFEAILKAYEEAGGESSVFKALHIASLVISGNKVMGSNEVPGVHIDAESIPDGVRALITVEANTKLKQPIHLCFGMIPAEGIQHIISEFDIGEGANIKVLAHCTFPNAINLKHIMDAKIRVRNNARFTYEESHYHGPYGGIEVIPRAEIVIDEGGYYMTSFSLTHGRVGKLAVDYVADVDAYGVADLTTKAYGFGDDDITVRETIRLNGEGARGVAKSRIAVREHAYSHVFTTAEGNAPLARGHMDCTEIVRDEAIAENVPKVIVRNDKAQVTHEAAIGTVNRKELETLMARGLDEDTAIDVIIRGMLAG